MSEPTYLDKKLRDPEYLRLFQQEATILEMTEHICEVMQRKRVSRAELARRLKKTKGYVTHLLDGQNMTLRTLSDALTALGVELKVSSKPMKRRRNADAQ